MAAAPTLLAPALAAMLTGALGLACAALIGFAAHRASLCNVRAVADLMSGRPRMALALLQAVAWAAWLTGVLALVLGVAHAPVWLRASAGAAALGGMLFGVGAAINGGCSLSTLTRLADGETGMLATLAGFALGVAAWAWPLSLSALALQPVPTVWERIDLVAGGVALAVLSGLGLWAGLRARHRIQAGWRDRGRSMLAAIGSRLSAPRYPLAMAAALFGLAAGMLYATQGPWSHSVFARQGVLHALGRGESATAWQLMLLLALLGGMAASALQRRSLHWRQPASLAAWMRHAAGGVLMGMGAAIVPGGNDTMLFNGLPTLAPVAMLAYASMLAGIAAVLWGMRRLRGGAGGADGAGGAGGADGAMGGS
jgi:uncharacterized membrane protein YedE/YeeE